MAFIELKHKDGYPMLFNVNQIESVKPVLRRGFKDSESLIICQNVNYNVIDSYMHVRELIKRTTTIAGLNLEKEVVVHGDSN